jgi:hypothetical protein
MFEMETSESELCAVINFRKTKRRFMQICEWKEQLTPQFYKKNWS